jgi:hypothetical protein
MFIGVNLNKKDNSDSEKLSFKDKRNLLYDISVFDKNYYDNEEEKQPVCSDSFLDDIIIASYYS